MPVTIMPPSSRNMKPENLIIDREFAARLHVDMRTFRRWAREARLPAPCLRVSLQRAYWRLEDVQEFINAQQP